MKKINGPRKISVKVNNGDNGIYKILAETVYGSKKMIAEPGLTAYLLPDGTTLELYSEGAVQPAYLFSASSVVINYKVDDLQHAVAGMERAGAQLLSNIQKVCSSYSFCHLKVSEHHIIGLFEER